MNEKIFRGFVSYCEGIEVVTNLEEFSYASCLGSITKESNIIAGGIQ